MTCFARLCECIPCFARKYYIYIYALLCKAGRMCSLLCKEILYIYIYIQGCANVFHDHLGQTKKKSESLLEWNPRQMYSLLCKEIL